MGLWDPKPGSSAGNPIDVASPMIDPVMLREVLLQMAQDERVDFQVLIQLIYHYRTLAARMGAKSVKDVVPYVAMADVVREVVEKTGKPVIVILPNHKRDLEYLDIEELIREARDALLLRGIPVFDDLFAGLGAVAHVSRHTARKNGAAGV